MQPTDRLINLTCNATCAGLVMLGAYLTSYPAQWWNTLGTFVIIPVFVALMPEHRAGWLPLLRFHRKAPVRQPGLINPMRGLSGTPCRYRRLRRRRATPTLQ